MPEISLTDFVDFVIKAGSPKLTKVRDIISRGEYSPALDFWKAAREHISEFHRDTIDLGVLGEPVHSRKKQRYDAAFAGYKKFLRRVGNPSYFAPPSERWTSSGLVVRVNPEVGLLVNNKRHAIKLYFKDEEPTKHRLHAVLELMRISLKKGRFEDMIVAVLDVAKSKLITADRKDPGFAILLAAEAQAFMAIWNSLMEERNQSQLGSDLHKIPTSS